MSIRQKLMDRLGLVTKERFEALRRHSAMRSYVAAQVNRLTADWSSYQTSIDADIRAALVIVRQRARDLVQNNDYGRQFMRLLQVNVVGPNGFTLQMNIKNPDGTPDEPANTRIEDAWNDWCQRQNVSVSGDQSFRSICNQLIQYAGRDGEALLRPVFLKKSKYGLQLQVVEPEALDESYSERLTNGNIVKMGVELDIWRRPLNYYLRKIDPVLDLYGSLSYSRDHTILPASELIHGFDHEYVNQTRGISWIVQSLFRLKQLSAYEEAVVINARASAAKMIFLTSDAENEGQGYTGNDQDSDGNIINAIEPGGIEKLPAGLKPVSWDPAQPTTRHEMFLRSSLSGSAAGLGVAYMSLSTDLTSANYSSMRAGLLPERDAYTMLQNWFAETYLYPLFSIWLETALMKGVINLSNAKLEKFNRPVFVGRKWAWVDPAKDIDSKITAIAAGLESPFDVVGEQGKTLGAIYSDIAEAQKLAEKKGIKLVNSSSPKTPPQPDEPPTLPEDEPEDPLMKKALELANNGNGNGIH